MKLTYLTWGYVHDDAIIRAMEATGLTVEKLVLPKEFYGNWENEDILLENDKEKQKWEVESFQEALCALSGDIVFSVNFFARVSELCSKEAIPYCCWVLQLPNFDLYTSSVRNACNYLGICDSYLVERLLELDVPRVFLLPDAVELKETKKMPVEREACFVARYPEKKLNTEGMTLYGKGYLDAFLHAQRVLHGASILENGLLQRVQREFLSCNPVPECILPELRKLFAADRYLAPTCTGLQQSIFLQNFDSIMTIYSNGRFEASNAKKYPYIEEEEQRQKIYAGKEFTLVLAPHCLHHGIPRDTLEVIAAGGFPVCSFQKDYACFFQKDKNLVYFINTEEFKEAVVRYGNSWEERERVKMAAYEIVAAGHTYEHRIAVMLEMWGKL